MTNRPTGLIGLGHAPHVPARGQAYSACTMARLCAGPKAIENHRSPAVNDSNNKTGAQTARSRSYLASLPERTARAGAALAGGWYTRLARWHYRSRFADRSSTRR